MVAGLKRYPHLRARHGDHGLPGPITNRERVISSSVFPSRNEYHPATLHYRKARTTTVPVHITREQSIMVLRAEMMTTCGLLVLRTKELGPRILQVEVTRPGEICHRSLPTKNRIPRGPITAILRQTVVLEGVGLRAALQPWTIQSAHIEVEVLPHDHPSIGNSSNRQSQSCRRSSSLILHWNADVLLCESEEGLADGTVARVGLLNRSEPGSRAKHVLKKSKKKSIDFSMQQTVLFEGLVAKTRADLHQPR